VVGDLDCIASRPMEDFCKRKLLARQLQCLYQFPRTLPDAPIENIGSKIRSHSIENPENSNLVTLHDSCNLLNLQMSILGSDAIPSALRRFSCFIFGSTVCVCHTNIFLQLFALGSISSFFILNDCK